MIPHERANATIFKYELNSKIVNFELLEPCIITYRESLSRVLFIDNAGLNYNYTAYTIDKLSAQCSLNHLLLS